MKNIFYLIEDIKKRPELFIGSNKITDLYHFLNGYIYRDFAFNESLCNIFKQFHFWLPNKTGIENENWRENLLIYTEFNEQKSLILFFSFIDEYKEELGIKLVKTGNTD